MKRLMVCTAGALLAGWAGAAMAQTEAFTRCAGIEADAARLACYDSAVATLGAEQARAVEARRQAAAAAKAKADAEALALAQAQAKAKAEAEEKAKVTAFGQDSMPAEQRRETVQAERAEKLEGKLTEVLTDPLGKLILVLDNGQMWRQTEQYLGPTVRSGEGYRISRGMMGGYMMSLPRMGRSFRVARYR
jgi:hypothetical protein